MRYHLVKYCQENSENIQSVVKGPLEGRQMTLQQYIYKMAIGETCGYEITLLVLSQMFQTPILVICADMLWLLQSVKPIDCPIILVQKLDGKFLGTQCKKPVHVGEVPHIRLQMKKDKSTEVFHSTPLRNACDHNVGFANVTGEMLSPIPKSKKIQNIQSNHNYSIELNETESGDRVIESNELDVKDKSMSTDYREEFMVENNETINSEADTGLLSNHPQFQGNDIMIANETEATEATQKPKSLVSYEVTDGDESSLKQEDGNENSENSLQVDVTKCADDDEKLEDGQKILPQQDITTTDPDRTIDPDKTVDPNEHGVGKTDDDQQSVNNTEKEKKQTESENVIGSSQEIVQPMRMHLGLRGPKACTSKVTVRIRDLNIDLATPLEKNQVFTI